MLLKLKKIWDILMDKPLVFRCDCGSELICNSCGRKYND